MRRPLRLLALAAGAALVTGLILPGQASAGGPTSVLIVSPSTGQTASLYADDPDYALLLELLEPVPGMADNVQAGVGPGTNAITVTWLSHDVSVWRVDRILADAVLGPLIYTNDSMSAREPFDITGPGVWHRAQEPASLSYLLDRLGVLDAKNGAKPPTARAAELPAPAGPGATSDDAGWLWALPVLAGGIAIGLVGRPYVSKVARRWRERDRGPLHQLIDL